MLQRMWINQPSASQRHHNLHGMNVLADEMDERGYRDVYFTSGHVISMRITTHALSKGWK